MFVCSQRDDTGSVQSEGISGCEMRIGSKESRDDGM